MKKDGLVYTVLFSFVITFLFVFLLSLSNEGTKAIVARNQTIADARAVFVALNVGIDDWTAERIVEQYNAMQTVTPRNADSSIDVLSTQIDGATVYAQRVRGAGLWGEIELVVGYNSDFSRFTGIEVVRHNETPGLGGRIDEQWYKAQFRNQNIPTDGRLAMTRGSGTGDLNKEDSSVDAITGATRTSDAMKTILADAVRSIRAALF